MKERFFELDLCNCGCYPCHIFRTHIMVKASGSRVENTKETLKAQALPPATPKSAKESTKKKEVAPSLSDSDSSSVTTDSSSESSSSSSSSSDRSRRKKEK